MVNNDVKNKVSSAFTDTVNASYKFAGQSFIFGKAVQDGKVLDATVSLPLATLNRHGLIAGATGTGKTKSLQKMLESLSKSGVPSLVLDIKGDLSGIAFEGEKNEKVQARLAMLQTEWQSAKLPVEFLSISDAKGTKVRATLTELGPVLLSKVLGLNDTQSSIISLIFKYCDDNGLLILDLDDLKKVLQYLTTDGKEEITKQYGAVAGTSMSTIMRQIIEIEEQGASHIFGEKSFEVADLVRTNSDGLGYISVLRVSDIQGRPKLFSTVMLSLLSEIYEEFEELGDVEKPKLCIFIDEAHLLFDSASPVLLERLEQTIKLIRSKGVGIYFITQNPIDIPASILSQLGIKIQHALRAFTANDNKAIKLAADNFPTSTVYDVPNLLTALGIGEALVTCLDERGNPTTLVHTMICPPETRMDTITESELDSICQNSSIHSKYEEVLNRESAYEVLSGKIATNQENQKSQEATQAQEKESGKKEDGGFFQTGSIMKSILRTITVTTTGAIVRQIIRGVLGGTKKK
jgi:uncharacterized protein